MAGLNINLEISNADINRIADRVADKLKSYLDKFIPAPADTTREAALDNCPLIIGETKYGPLPPIFIDREDLTSTVESQVEPADPYAASLAERERDIASVAKARRADASRRKKGPPARPQKPIAGRQPSPVNSGKIPDTHLGHTQKPVTYKKVDKSDIPEGYISMTEFADRAGIKYITIWQRVKAGHLEAKDIRKEGSKQAILVLKESDIEVAKQRPRLARRTNSLTGISPSKAITDRPVGHIGANKLG